MNQIKVYVVAARGPTMLLRQFRWWWEHYPHIPHEKTARGLLNLEEDADGIARGVWYSTLPNHVYLPESVERVQPTEEELLAAEERVAAFYVRNAVGVNNYREVAKVFLAKHRQARKEPTEFDAICVAAVEESKQAD